MKVDFLQEKGIDNLSNLGMNLVTAFNEYIDNAIEAEAKNIIIFFENDGMNINAIIIEDGNGMDDETLQYALSFGGEGAGVKKKDYTDIGKYHAGITIASFGISDYTDVYSNNGDGWVKNFINKNKLKKTRKIDSSTKSNIPKEVDSILEEAKIEKGLDLELKTGTIIVIKNLYKKIVGVPNFEIEISNIFNNICVRYHNYLSKEGSIYIIVNNAKDIRKCKSIHPLLKDKKLLKDNGLEIIANFKYENILTINEVLPYSLENDSMDIEFVLIRKIKKNDKMLKADDLVKLNMENQGSYFDRNNLTIIRGEKIGFNKKHNSFNGLRNYSNLNGKWDNVLGITINKSVCNVNSRFYELLNERLKKLCKHLRKVLANKENLNLPIIELSNGRTCNPKILYLNGNDEKIDIIKADKEHKKKDNYIIFAAKGKPNLNINLTNLDIKFNKDNQNYYIYNKEISNLGVKKSDIEKWCLENKIEKDEFYNKIEKSIRNSAEYQIKFYKYYMKNIYTDYKNDFFIFPEVYVNVNVKKGDLENKQCVDFMIILPSKQKIIIEIDGIGHYGKKRNEEWYADIKNYTIDRKFDRQMQLDGYKVFRFSNSEIDNTDLLDEFFERLFS